jgi:hypothetical protein
VLQCSVLYADLPGTTDVVDEAVMRTKNRQPSELGDVLGVAREVAGLLD